MEQPPFPGMMQMVLLEEAMRTTAPELETFFQEKLGNPDITIQGAPDDNNSFVMLWGKFAFSIMLIDQPIPAETFEVALRTSQGLSNGEQLIAAHKAHLIIAPLKHATHQLQAIYNAMGLMTLADFLSEKSKPLAYFWSGSQILADAEGFGKALAGASQAMDKYTNKESDPWYDLPSTYWVGMRMLSPDRKTQFGAVTAGLASLTGFEIQVDPFLGKPVEAAKHLFGMAGYALNHGPVFKDNDTIGIGGQQQFRMRLQPGASSGQAPNDLPVPPRWIMTLETIS
ncbi:DUF4261 domain-containing protein [Marinibactrum halimedae]|uniref:DUF4261 domain-containing protein n=1 Tax=Marinibactrum halimedae TaxID=1444977 RepID=A0AA37T946_9GAMM|nr:DUF4261 domain-containing protein [Marinibactrum halimedae]MCD9457699.1 DUF4261 domain-containing protein [Marinibactrum halimedae]GLS24927.1 hypothetical protein GCM10007877_06410 [Marinibactrum halimedae]